jgi:halocyanin-like protein
MGRNDDLDRRTVLRGVAGVFGAGVLAGCSGGGTSTGGSSGTATNGGSGGGASTETGSGASTAGTNTTTSAGTATESTAGTTGTSGGNAQVDQWLGEANNYNGSIADKTGSGTVKIAVGAGESGFAFDPAAVRVSAGTTIRWQWTGRGGAHNVVAKEGTFDSGAAKAGSDITYEKTLDQSGTYLYYCVPHRRLGMKGAVVVTG